MDAYAAALKYGMLTFMSLIAIEFIAGLLLKKNVYKTFDTVAGISSGITNNIKTIFNLSIVVISYEWLVSHFGIWDVKATWWIFLIAFIGKDFASYWSHRWNHEFNLLWNRHIVHHSSEEYNLSAALRQPISDIVQIYFFLYLPLAIIGVPTSVIAIIAPIHLFLQFWYHTTLIDKMGWLENVLMTPSLHRVHHAINPEYIDKNYSAIFIIWDKLFGTFQEEMEDVPPVYGVKKPVSTWNPFWINFQHLWGLIKDAWRTQSWSDKMRIWFMPTGWRPADVKEKYPIHIDTNPYDQVKYQTQSTPGLRAWVLIQLALHILIQFHLIRLLPDWPMEQLIVGYGVFVLLSVFSYTTLMDRKSWAVVPELVKTFWAGLVLSRLGGWFDLNEMIPYGTQIVVGYLVVSLVVTIYYTYVQNESNPSVSHKGMVQV